MSGFHRQVLFFYNLPANSLTRAKTRESVPTNLLITMELDIKFSLKVPW